MHDLKRLNVTTVLSKAHTHTQTCTYMSTHEHHIEAENAHTYEHRYTNIHAYMQYKQTHVHTNTQSHVPANTHICTLTKDVQLCLSLSLWRGLQGMLCCSGDLHKRGIRHMPRTVPLQMSLVCFYVWDTIRVLTHKFNSKFMAFNMPDKQWGLLWSHFQLVNLTFSDDCFETCIKF